MQRWIIGSNNLARQLPSPKYDCAHPNTHARLVEMRRTHMSRLILLWLRRTPVGTFIVCPAAVVAFEFVLHHGRITFVPLGLILGLILCTWGYLQYLLVGRYRVPIAGGSRGMTVPPQRLVTQGPYRYTRNPMYLGHLIFLLGLSLAFWSWFALILLIGRAFWFNRRVLRDEKRLGEIFGSQYVDYRKRVRRWIPGLF
jgi:protein-S-isoprenylcysteine O-methyltransferase Ste14